MMINASETATPTMTEERPILPDSTHSNGEQETMDSSASNTPTQQDTANTPFTTLHPHAHDVLCGRGGAVNHHPGNVKFRKLVRQRKKEYLELPLKDNRKTLIIQDIVVRVKSQDPPGKFLSKNAKGEWVEIDDALAAHKTSQALRERDNATSSSGMELLAEDLHSMRAAAARGGQKRSLDEPTASHERPLKKTRGVASNHEGTIPELALPPPAMDEMVPPLTFDRYGYIVPPVDTQIPYLTPEGWFTPTTMPLDSSGISPSNAVADIPNIAEDTAKLVEQSIDDDDNTLPVATPPRPRRKKKKKGERTYDAPIFLQKTYHMVEHCDDPSVLSWSDDGTMMVIKDTAKLGADIIPKYFRHNKFTSFVRQLNFYGFHKVKSTKILVQNESDNKNHWVFCHAKFQRGRPDLLHEISKKAAHDSDAPSKEEFNALQQEMKELKSYIAKDLKKKEMRQTKKQWSPRHQSSSETLSLKKEVRELKMRVANLEKLVTFLGQSSEGTASAKSVDKRDRSKVYDLEYVPGVRGNQHSCV